MAWGSAGGCPLRRKLLLRETLPSEVADGGGGGSNVDVLLPDSPVPRRAGIGIGKDPLAVPAVAVAGVDGPLSVELGPVKELKKLLRVPAVPAPEEPPPPLPTRAVSRASMD
jgi:hypothetical protein